MKRQGRSAEIRPVAERDPVRQSWTMSRRKRHIHAQHDEWVVVHRDPSPSGGGAGCLLLALVLLIPGCAESFFHGPIGWFILLMVIGLVSPLFMRS